MRKKILYIHHGQGLGGAPLSLLYLIEGLDKNLFEPIVLFLKDSEVVDLYKSRGIQVYGPLKIEDFSHTKIWWYKWYHPHHLLRSLRDSLKTVFSVAEYWLEKIGPDIVHLNTSSLIAWGKVSHRLGIPVVWHIREPLALGYLGIRREIIKKSVKKYSTLIMPICKNDAKPWTEDARVKVVYNAVDDKFFDVHKVSPIKLEGTGLKILYLGGLSKEKGTLLILKVFERLLEKVPDARLLIAGYFDSKVGSGVMRYLPTEKYKVAVNKALKKVEHAVTLLGVIRNIPSFMAASDVIVFPATEGHFARPIIEAGFMKKPVVASNLPPLDELVVDGKTGFLVDPKNIKGWARTLDLLNNENLRLSVGEKAYAYCTDRFKVEDQVRQIQKCYLSLPDA